MRNWEICRIQKHPAELIIITRPSLLLTLEKRTKTGKRKEPAKKRDRHCRISRARNREGNKIAGIEPLLQEKKKAAGESLSQFTSLPSRYKSISWPPTELHWIWKDGCIRTTWSTETQVAWAQRVPFPDILMQIRIIISNDITLWPLEPQLIKLRLKSTYY